MLLFYLLIFVKLYNILLRKYIRDFSLWSFAALLEL